MINDRTRVQDSKAPDFGLGQSLELVLSVKVSVLGQGKFQGQGKFRVIFKNGLWHLGNTKCTARSFSSKQKHTKRHSEDHCTHQKALKDIWSWYLSGYIAEFKNMCMLLQVRCPSSCLLALAAVLRRLVCGIPMPRPCSCTEHTVEDDVSTDMPLTQGDFPGFPVRPPGLLVPFFAAQGPLSVFWCIPEDSRCLTLQPRGCPRKFLFTFQSLVLLSLWSQSIHMPSSETREPHWPFLCGPVVVVCISVRSCGLQVPPGACQEPPSTILCLSAAPECLCVWPGDLHVPSWLAPGTSVLLCVPGASKCVSEWPKGLQVHVCLTHDPRSAFPRTRLLNGKR